MRSTSFVSTTPAQKCVPRSIFFPLALKPIRLLRDGRASMVFQCSNSSDSIQDKSVVVKFVRDEEEAKSEVDTLTRMWHPNVVNFIDIVAWGTNEWFGIMMKEMEMDLCVFTQNEIYGASIVADISRQSAGGLHHVHELGTLHADIKLENIGVTVSRNEEKIVHAAHVRLIDFGSARLVSSIRNGDTIRSTRHYQSPEKRVGVFHYPGDIYELGIVFQEVLSCSIDGRSTTAAAAASSQNDIMYNELISDMTMSDFNLRPTSFQLIARLQDPYHDLQGRLRLISSSSYDDVIQLNDELADFIQCEDPLIDFLPCDFDSRIEFITRNASSSEVRSLEWYMFLLFKTSQQIAEKAATTKTDGGRKRNHVAVVVFVDERSRAVFYSSIRHFNGLSNSSWMTKLLYCMIIDIVSKLDCFRSSSSLDESIAWNLCDYSTVIACETRIRNTLSRCLTCDLLQLCCSMPEWGAGRVDFNTFIDQSDNDDNDDDDDDDSSDDEMEKEDDDDDDG